jgi:hypothetical protein
MMIPHAYVVILPRGRYLVLPIVASLTPGKRVGKSERRRVQDRCSITGEEIMRRFP